MKKFLRNTRWAILWGLFLFTLHILPGSVFPKLPTYLDLLQPDKMVHVVMFGVLTCLLIMGYSREGSPLVLTKHPVLAAIITALLFGAVMELIQNYFVPNRIGDIYDEIADFAGSLLGWGFWALYKKFVK
jgi:VanZ family protein